MCTLGCLSVCASMCITEFSHVYIGILVCVDLLYLLWPFGACQQNLVVCSRAARCMVLAQKQVQLNGDFVLETWTLPCERACSLNLLGSIPASCLNVGRVALKAPKWIFRPQIFPPGFSPPLFLILSIIFPLAYSLFSLLVCVHYYTISVFPYCLCFLSGYKRHTNKLNTSISRSISSQGSVI